MTGDVVASTQLLRHLGQEQEHDLRARHPVQVGLMSTRSLRFHHQLPVHLDGAADFDVVSQRPPAPGVGQVAVDRRPEPVEVLVGAPTAQTQLGNEEIQISTNTRCPEEL